MILDLCDVPNITELVEFPGYYISPMGDLYSGRSYQGHWLGNGKIRKLKCPPNGRGYRTSILCTNGARFNRMIHRLVLETFVGSCPKGMQCRHLDGNKFNNKLDNLCWGTPKENASDRTRHGNTRKKERHTNAKLTQHNVDVIRTMRSSGSSLRSIATSFGISISQVSAICTGRAWPATSTEDSNVSSTSITTETAAAHANAAASV